MKEYKASFTDLSGFAPFEITDDIVKALEQGVLEVLNETINEDLFMCFPLDMPANELVVHLMSTECTNNDSVVKVFDIREDVARDIEAYLEDGSYGSNLRNLRNQFNALAMLIDDALKQGHR